MFQTLALVFLGGGGGSVCRYAVWLALRPWTDKFPWATFAANALACLLLGALLGRQAQGLLSDQHRLLLVTGFCGGFSTYSTFTSETWGLWQSGNMSAVLANVFLQLAVCMVCLLAGLRLTA
ncbi:MAG: CrcB family protein [Lewinellaceae bacterium]|nr:CrcB family protein [Lewinellaceae bacterium]